LIEYKKQTTTFKTPFGKTVIIQEGDGYADKVFARRSKKVFEVIPDFLAHVVIQIDALKNPDREGILNLKVPDQEWVSIENYKFNYGNILNLYNVCPKCGEPIHTRKDLTELEVVPLPKEMQGQEDPVLVITLPKTKVKASVGFLNGHQEQLLMGLAAQGLEDPNQADLQVLRELDGAPPTYEDVINLPHADHLEIRGAREKLICGYKPVATISCGICGYKEVSNFLTHRGFLLPKG
jgi:ribosomal protein S27AE